jgi:hypothetical protein
MQDLFSFLQKNSQVVRIRVKTVGSLHLIQSPFEMYALNDPSEFYCNVFLIVPVQYTLHF